MRRFTLLLAAPALLGAAPDLARLTVDSPVPGQRVFGGVALLGETPLLLSLPPGPLELTVQSVDLAEARRIVPLRAGTSKQVRLRPRARPVGQPLPEWTQGRAPCPPREPCTVGQAAGFVDPLAAETSALVRALGGLALGAVRQRRVEVPRPDAFELPLRGPRLQERADDGAGRAAVRVALCLDPASRAPAPVSARGAAHPALPAAEHDASAALAALGRALLLLALERRDVTVAVAVAEEAGERYHRVRVQLDTALGAEPVLLQIRLAHRDHLRAVQDHTPPLFDSRLTVEARRGERRARFAVTGGVVDPASLTLGAEAAAAGLVLAEIEAATQALGIKVARRSLPSLRGLPQAEVTLSAPAGALDGAPKSH